MRYGVPQLRDPPTSEATAATHAMRICIIMEYHPADLTGGSETQAFGLARAFARAGHDVSYVCQRYKRDRPVDDVVDGVRVLRTLRWHSVFRSLVAWQLVRTVRNLRPEVIYQRFASPLTGLAAIAARYVGASFVWGCSEDESLEKGRLLYPPSGHARPPLRSVKKALLRLNGRMAQTLFDFGLRRAKVVVVQTQSQMSLLQVNLGLTGVLIPNGVALTQPQEPKSPTPLVLWLNRIAPRKNAEAFVDLARSLQVERPDARFVVVGGRQEDDYLASVRKRASGVQNLTLTGNLPPNEVRRWFEQAWIFVLTSKSEGFPNVLLEAWAAGLPVVSLEFDPDGLIADKGLGLVSKTGDGLRRDVELLLSDADLRKKLAERSRTYAAQHFEFSKVAEQYLELFQTIAAR
jgi:glycosyltransferase involved in cell wall biosynthesis